MRQATRELVNMPAGWSPRCWTMCWNCWPGTRGSAISVRESGPPPELIKQQEKQGTERSRICQMLRKKLGENNAEISVL